MVNGGIWLPVAVVGLVFVLYVWVIQPYYSRKPRLKEVQPKNKEKKIRTRTFDYGEEGGKVSILVDADMNVIVIPYTAAKKRSGKAAGLPLYLNHPYTENQLGQTLRRALDISNRGKSIDSASLMKALGSRDWRIFSKDKKNISLYYVSGTGLVLNSTSQVGDGVFVFNKKGYEQVIPADAQHDVLGRGILEIYKKCK